jgi:hypothetical protein
MSTTAAAEDIVKDTIADGRWFPLRFSGQQFEFAFITPDQHRQTTFLIYLEPPANEMRAIAAEALIGAQLARTDLHFILHTGFGGSTLLGKLLAQPGAAITLQEPPIVTDIVRLGPGLSRREATQLLQETTQLLSRPITAGEALVCKMTHVGNGIASSMATIHPASQLLCLETPLEEMLASLVARGMEGRIAARKIFISIQDSKMNIIGLSDRGLAEHTDLQLAALAWLSMQKMMLDAAARLGPQRVGSISTEQLMQDTRGTLAAVARHFRLDLDIDARLSDGTLERHSKTGEPFNAELRAKRVARELNAHKAEIEPVVNWARRLAAKTGIAWELPYPLRS